MLAELVPVVGALATGGVFDRFPQSSGGMRLVSSPAVEFEASYV